MKPTGRKEIGEAVLIAALCAVVTGAIGWGFEETKKKVEAFRARKVAQEATLQVEEEEGTQR